MSKINLSELPPAVDTVRALFRGQPDYFTAQDSYYTQDQMRAYAEEAVRQALAAPTQALKCIAGIENKMFGGDWDEIDEARSIANDALGALLLWNRDG